MVTKFLYSYMSGVLFAWMFAANVNANVPAETHLREQIPAIKQLIAERMQSQNVPGVSVALVAGGKIIYADGFGRANNQGKKMLATTPTSLGSVSKSFTAVAVMQLVEEGKIALSDRIALYHPEILEAGPDASTITIKQLLNHTSGFSTYAGNLVQADFSHHPDALLKGLMHAVTEPLTGKPGARFEYSNANYQALGLLLERVEKSSYEQIIQSKVLDRLNLTNSFVLSAGPEDPEPAEPFRYWLKWPVRFDQPSARTAVAGGGVYASATDMAIYLLDLLSEEPRLLSASVRNQLFEVHGTEEYGLGWVVDQQESHTVVSHNGLNPGFEAETGFIPATGIGFVALANAGSGLAFGNVAGLLEGVRALALKEELPPASPSTSGMLYMGVVLVVVLIFGFGFFRACIRTATGSYLGLARPLTLADSILRLIIPSILLLACAWLFAFLVPKIFSIALLGLRAFSPDIGWGLTLAAGFAFGWAVVLIIGRLRPNKAP